MATTTRRNDHYGTKRQAEMDKETCVECGKVVSSEGHYKGMITYFCYNKNEWHNRSK